jgi:hypothetical protein
MQLLENIFLGMFLLGFLFTIVSAFFSGAFGHAFGEGSAFDAGGAHPGELGGHDIGHSPADGHPAVGWTGGHDLPTFSPLSPTVGCAFLAAAGGAGFVAIHSWDWGGWAATGLAVASGVVFAAVVFFGLAFVFRTAQGSSVVALDSLVGTEAEVNQPIPSGGFGEIAYVSSGQRLVQAARCADGAAVPQGARVVIKSVLPTVFVVEETRESWLVRSRAQGSRTAS